MRAKLEGSSTTDFLPLRYSVVFALPLHEVEPELGLLIVQDLPCRREFADFSASMHDGLRAPISARYRSSKSTYTCSKLPALGATAARASWSKAFDYKTNTFARRRGSILQGCLMPEVLALQHGLHPSPLLRESPGIQAVELVLHALSASNLMRKCR